MQPLKANKKEFFSRLNGGEVIPSHFQSKHRKGMLEQFSPANVGLPTNSGDNLMHIENYSSLATPQCCQLVTSDNPQMISDNPKAYHARQMNLYV